MSFRHHCSLCTNSPFSGARLYDSTVAEVSVISHSSLFWELRYVNNVFTTHTLSSYLRIQEKAKNGRLWRAVWVRICENVELNINLDTNKHPMLQLLCMTWYDTLHHTACHFMKCLHSLWNLCGLAIPLKGSSLFNVLSQDYFHSRSIGSAVGFWWLQIKLI